MFHGNLRLLLSSIVALLALAAPSAAATDGAKGRLCGRTGCVAIPHALAVGLAQRSESYSPASRPRPAPFYRIKIKGTGEGYISRTIVWVPSRKVWFSKDYVTPPLPGDWRTETKKRWLRLVTRTVKPFPAPAHLALVLPK